VAAVKVRAKVFTDDTGVAFDVPVLLTENGVVTPLLDYLLDVGINKSATWMNEVIHATYVFLQYLEGNKKLFDQPELLFQSFVHKIYAGTIGSDGYDESGLYWLPSSTRSANSLLRALSRFTNWIARANSGREANILDSESSIDKRLRFAAWYRRNQYDFLGHIKPTDTQSHARQAYMVHGRKVASLSNNQAITFPEHLFERFFVEGIGGARDRRSAIRNQLIVLMMHFSGCRESDALHLWIEDVLVDPHYPESVMIRLYHPEDGKAPGSWKAHNGRSTRSAYLKQVYALTPRNRLLGTKRVGWKSTVVDHKDNYILLHWFPRVAGTLFGLLWREYLRHVALVDRHHPYAFISFEKNSQGEPLTLNAFNDAYARGVRRIGEIPAKAHGLSPHGHRHAMGRRLHTAGVHPRLIKEVLHHSSLSSQLPYTIPSARQITKKLDAAYEVLEKKAENGDATIPIPNWRELLEFGFEDIDPDGFFSGGDPKLRPPNYD